MHFKVEQIQDDLENYEILTEDIKDSLHNKLQTMATLDIYRKQRVPLIKLYFKKLRDAINE